MRINCNVRAIGQTTVNFQRTLQRSIDLLFKVDKCKAIKFNIIIGIKKFSNTSLFMGK